MYFSCDFYQNLHFLPDDAETIAVVRDISGVGLHGLRNVLHDQHKVHTVGFHDFQSDLIIVTD